MPDRASVYRRAEIERKTSTFTFTLTDYLSHQLVLSGHIWTVKRSRNIWTEPRQAQGEHANTTKKA